MVRNLFPPFQPSLLRIMKFLEVIGIFSSTRTCDRGLVSSSAPVIVDARDGIHNPPDLYGWSVGLWHGETDPGGSSIP